MDKTLAERLEAMASLEGVCGQSDVRRLAFLEAARAVREAGAAAPQAPVDDAAVERATAAVQKWLDWCSEHNEAPEARSGARIVLEAVLQQPAGEK
jgi:hypothetical protein